MFKKGDKVKFVNCNFSSENKYKYKYTNYITLVNNIGTILEIRNSVKKKIIFVVRFDDGKVEAHFNWRFEKVRSFDSEKICKNEHE